VIRTAVVVGTLLGAGTVQAQMSLELQAGVGVSGTLVEDAIVNVVTVRPSIGPHAGVGVMAEFAGPFHAGARIGWTHSNLEREELGARMTILPLTVWSGMFVLGARVTRAVSAEARFGAVKYAPGGDSEGTLFQDASPLAAAFGLGVRAERSLGARWALGVHAAYDLHQFETQTLRAAGFTGARTVHRITAGASIRWRGNPHHAN
jgi:hypothetical protein